MAKVQIKGPIISNDQKWIYDWYDMDSTCPRDIDKVIAEANGEDLEVEINSGGGYVHIGSEIYTTLKGYAGDVIVKIVGVAGSSASVAAMSGTKVLISPTAQIMIHNVSSRVEGDYRVLQHEADVSKNYNVSIANAYILKTGLEEKELLKLMDNVTWLNAQQAKEKGFVDEIMFDDDNQLVANFGDSAMLPQAVINKMRNQKQDELQTQETKNLAISKAKLNLLKLEVR